MVRSLMLMTKLLLPAALAAQVGSTEVVRLALSQETTLGQSVYVLGDRPELGSGDVRRALKLSPENYPEWSASLAFPSGTELRYRYLLRADSAAAVGDAANGTFLSPTDLTATVPGVLALSRSGVLRYFSGAAAPTIMIESEGGFRPVVMVDEGEGRTLGERLWSAPVSDLPPAGSVWRFYVDLGGGAADRPSYGPLYVTSLANLWLQDGSLHAVRPHPTPSRPRVTRHTVSTTVGNRTVYVYVPRGYDQATDRRYPVLLMHDGQNCFQAFVSDAAFGNSWRADETATRLIDQGRLDEFIIVGIAHGSNRIVEYLPPYASFFFQQGQAGATVGAYRSSVLPWLASTFRAETDREHLTTLGSSMGGVLSTYIAWEHPDMAARHGSVSPAYWIMKDGAGRMEIVERLRARPANPPERFWLDSGTTDSSPTIPSDDGMIDTYRARDAMLSGGFVLQDDMAHFLAIGANHSEPSWAARLEQILLYLLPAPPEPADAEAGQSWVLD